MLVESWWLKRKPRVWIDRIEYFRLRLRVRSAVHAQALMANPNTQTLRFRRPTNGPQVKEKPKEQRHQGILQDQLRR